MMKATDAVAAKRISAGRTSLLVAHPFFGTLLMFLNMVETFEIETMGVDGISLFYNPTFVKSLSDEELRGVLVHEIAHLILKHILRIGNRDMKLWNVACDYAINLFLSKCNITLPHGALLDTQYEDLTAEMIYEILPKKPSAEAMEAAMRGMVMPCPGTGSGGDDKDQNNPGKNISAEQAAANAARIEAEINSRIHMAAAAAKGSGKLPAGIAMMIDQLTESKVDWQVVLSRFVDAYAKSDYSWARQSRAMMRRGLIGPGMLSEELGDALIVLDLSGSIDTKERIEELSEVFGILDRYDVNLTLATADTRIYMIGQWERGDIPEPKDLELRGGGGTSLDELNDWVNENGLMPRFCLYLTDGYLTDWGSPTPFPLLVGVLPGGTASYVPDWAEVVHIIE